MPGNVTIRFGVQDQEVVRKALEALGKDGEAALRRLDAAGRQPSQSMKAVSQAVGDVRNQAIGMAQSLGPVGTALVALGPWGLAAGAAIGGLALAFRSLSERAHAFAAEATQLSNTAELIGLTTTKLDAIKDAASDFAISGEKVTAFLTRFAAQIEEVRRHEGQLFELLQRIDPAIARQMSTARGTAEALDLLGKAAERATDSQRAALARLTGGRGNADVLLLIRDIASRQGGIGQLTEAFQQSGDAIDENLIKRVKILKTQIDDMAGDARRNFDSIFSETMLQKQHQATERWREFSRLARDFALSPDLDRFLTMMAGGFRTQEARSLMQALMATPFGPMLMGASAITQGVSGPPKPLTPEQLARARLRMGLMQGFRGQLDDVWQPDLTPRQLTPAAQLADARRNMGILGSAATPAEQLDLKQKELNAAVEKFGKDVLPLTNRALAAYTLELDKQAVSIRVRLGIASAEEQMAIRLRELQDQRAKGFIKNNDEMAAAEQMLRRELEATLRQQEIRKSVTPQLTALSIEARDLTANIDRDLTGALRGTGQEMLSMLKGTEKLSDGLNKLGMSFLDVAFNALWMRTVVGPLANLGSGALSALGLPGSFQFAGPGAPLNIAPSALGNVFSGGRLMPFARGGVLSRPIMFPFANGIGLAGEAGPEAIMPLKRDARSGRLGVETSGGGGAQVNVTIENHAGADVGVKSQRNASGGADLRVMVRQAVREDLGRGEHDAAMGARFGNRPSRVRR